MSPEGERGLSGLLRIVDVGWVAAGSPATVDEVVTINIMPGWRRGHPDHAFLEKGHEQPGMVPADLVFVIDEKPHEVFAREGSDLVVAPAHLARRTPLTGLHALRADARRAASCRIPVNEVVFPGYEKVVEREGMPGKDPSKRGRTACALRRAVPH